MQRLFEDIPGPCLNLGKPVLRLLHYFYRGNRKLKVVLCTAADDRHIVSYCTSTPYRCCHTLLLPLDLSLAEAILGQSSPRRLRRPLAKSTFSLLTRTHHMGKQLDTRSLRIVYDKPSGGTPLAPACRSPHNTIGDVSNKQYCSLADPERCPDGDGHAKWTRRKGRISPSE